MIRSVIVFLWFVIGSGAAYAEPTLKQRIFEFNTPLKVQEEFLILTTDTVSDPSYSLNDLRIQLNSQKTYEQIGFYDKVYTTYGQAVAYNTLDRRWSNFKNKLLYFSGESTGTNKFETILFRVMNPDGEVSQWGEIRISLGGQFDQGYDYYPADDSVDANSNTAVNIDVLNNDPNVQSYYSSEIYAYPANGTLILNADNTITYTPHQGFTGSDSFVYRVIGNNLYELDSAPATVFINVQSANEAPVAVDDRFSFKANTPVTHDVIANDTDQENDFIYLLSVGTASNGIVDMASNRMVRYTPNEGYCSSDSFTYVVSQDLEGVSSDEGVVEVTCQNSVPEISGTPTYSVSVGNEYEFMPLASDSDGDSLIFYIQNKPTWAQFDEKTGLLSGTPSIDDAKVYQDISVSVSDGVETVSLASFEIQVQLDSPLNFNATPLEIAAGKTLNLSWNKPDNHGVGLLYTLSIDMPDNSVTQLLQSNLAELSYEIALEVAGAYKFYVRSCNSAGVCSDYATATVTVSDASSKRNIIFIHTDLLGTPVAETKLDGSIE